MAEGLDKFRANDYKLPDEERLPTPKEEYRDRTMLDGKLWTAILAYMNRHKYNFKCYGRRTAKFSKLLTTFKTDLEAFVAANDSYLLSDVTTSAIADEITKRGGAITRSGGSRFVVLWGTPESVRMFREDRRKQREQEQDKQ